jgi:transcriptional regulator GlxA family with amidase domain
MTAYLDLCLYIVSRFGSMDLASTASKLLLVDSGRRSQAPYRVPRFLKNHADADILRTQQWLEAHTAEAVTVQHMAEVAGLERRTFLRRFKRATGEAPRQYVQHLRIESARRMLETTGDTVSEITWRVGYADVSSFQRLFKRHTGLTPGAYRDKFSLLFKEKSTPDPDTPAVERPVPAR